MQYRHQHYDSGTFLIDIYAYENGIPDGQFYHPILGIRENFFGLMQLLLQIERIMDESNYPQAFHTMHSFAPLYLVGSPTEADAVYRKKLASFSLQIKFRRNASWQGTVFWMERRESQNFRSFLELSLLFNNALCSQQLTSGLTPDKPQALTQAR